MATKFSTHLKELRKKAGYSQTELAEKLNIHPQTVSKWERGICEPDFSVYGLLASTLNVSLEQLWDVPAPEEPVYGDFDLSKLGLAIAAERKRAGESQDVLASVALVSPNTVSKWERGLVCPDRDTFLKITEHFNIFPSNLYYAKTSDGSQPEIKPAIKQRREKLKIKFNKKKITTALAVIGVLILVAAIVVLCLIPFNSDGDGDKNDDPPAVACQHDYELTTYDPTCSLQGYTSYKCVKCGYGYNSDYVEKLPHTVSEWIVDSTPNCDKAGKRHRECEVCHKTLQTETIPALQHSPDGEWIIEREPTCAKEGERYRLCSVCGNKGQTEKIEKTDHSYGAANVVPPTCVVQGYTQYNCSVCGYGFQTDFTQTIPHTWGNWITEEEATCVSTGSRRRECVACHNSWQTDIIEMLEHDYKVQIVSGVKYNVCSFCGHSYKIETTAPEIKGMYFEFNYDTNTCVLKSADEDIGPKVVIPSEVDGCKVVEIYERVFEDCVYMQEVVIPDTVGIIGMYAFKRCVLLTEVTLPDSVTELGDEAFQGCRNLKKVILPSKIKRLKYSLFSDCVSLQNAEIPQSVAIIEDLAFHNCQKLNGIVLSENLTHIGLFAFNNCHALEEITIPKNVIYIGDNAFTDCTSLKAIIFEDPEGWSVDTTEIASEKLKNPETAVAYFTEIYKDKIFLKKVFS